MKKGTRWVGALALITLAGCSTTERVPDRSVPRISCNGNQCDATVTVTSTGAACKPDGIIPIDLATGRRGAKTVTWVMGTEGYVFSDESYKWGLFVKDDPFDEFKDARVTANGRRLTITFNDRLPGKSYRYAITVRRAGGAKEFCETLDPWLLN
jgi:hypothetical protein